MSDPTHAPTPAEIRRIKDPKRRYHAARAAEALMKRELSEIGRDVVNDLHKGGMNGPDIAALLGITRQRVAQLLPPELLAEARVEKLGKRAAKLAEEAAKVREAIRKVEDDAEITSGQLCDEDVREILARPDMSEDDLAAQFNTSPGAIRYVRSERVS